MQEAAIRIPLGTGVVHLLGTVSGLVSEAPRVTAFLDAVRPHVVALGVSPDEVEALRHFRPDPEADDGVEDAEYDPGYAQALLQYGEISLPPPDLLAAVEWAELAGARLEGLDMAQAAYDAAFARHVGTWDFLRYGSRTRRLGRRPPQAATAREFITTWDRELRKLRGISVVETLRERHMAESLARLASGGAVVAAIVAASREEGIQGALPQAMGKNQK